MRVDLRNRNQQSWPCPFVCGRRPSLLYVVLQYSGTRTCILSPSRWMVDVKLAPLSSPLGCSQFVLPRPRHCTPTPQPPTTKPMQFWRKFPWIKNVLCMLVWGGPRGSCVYVYIICVCVYVCLCLRRFKYDLTLSLGVKEAQLRSCVVTILVLASWLLGNQVNH